MKTFHYEQLVYCSSQKSVVTGQPGFGVRSKSAGLENSEAEDIVSLAKVSYAIPMEQRATKELILEHPQLDELYPPLYTYKKIKFASGEERFIIARTIYVGIDYGYFAQIDGAQRDGANYITHIFIFNEEVPVSVLEKLIENNSFVPQNTLCSPNNEDICTYLIGEPVSLTDGEITIDEDCEIAIGEEGAELIVAFMQAYKNQRTNEYAKKIIYKAPQERLLKLLPIFGIVPARLIQDVYFQINNMEAYDVPLDLSILFVNEKNNVQIETDYNIVVDCLQSAKQTYNIEKNVFYNHVRLACAEGNMQMLNMIVSAFCELDFSKEIDYEAVYDAVMLAHSDEEISLESYSTTKIQKLVSLSLPHEDRDVIETKLNNSLNAAFENINDLQNLKRALDTIEGLDALCPSALHINSTSGNFLMKEIWGEGKDTLIPIIEHYHKGVFYVLKKADEPLPDEEKFLQLLPYLQDKNQWLAFIQFYYTELPSKTLVRIVDLIMQSNFPSRKELIEELLNTRYSVRRNSESTAHILETIWRKADSEEEQDYAIKLFSKLTDKNNQNIVMSMIDDEALLDALNQKGTWQKRLLQKAKNLMSLFSKSIFMLLVIAFCSCHVELRDDANFTPFQAQTYGLPVNGVAKVVEKETYPKGDIRTFEYELTKDGKLSSFAYFENSNKVTTSYDYARDGRIKSIANPNYEFVKKEDHNELRMVKQLEKSTNKEVNRTVYGYDTRGNITAKTTYYDNENRVDYEYSYYSDSRALKSVIIKSNDITIVQNIDSAHQWITKEHEYKGKKKKPTVYSYAYLQLDKEGNWLKCEKRNSKGKVLLTFTREYIYFAQKDAFMASNRRSAEFTSYQAVHFSDNAIVNYFKNLRNRIVLNQRMHDTPGVVLYIILSLLMFGFIWWFISYAKKKNILANFSGSYQDNNMKRMWMFNKEAYLDVLVVAAVVLLAFVAALTTLCVVGGLTFAILWIFKIILIIIVWVGWIALIGGALYLYASKEGIGCLPTLIGGLIVIFRDSIKNLGQRAVDWGFDFMSDLNIFGWGLSIFTNFWDLIVLSIGTPLFLFFSVATIIIMCVFLLMGVEKIVMSVYDIRRPCPVCGSTNTAEYWVDEHHKHPVALHPGLYGVFYQTNPDTGEKLPTMIFNGKGKLLRKCTNCHSWMKGNTQGQSTVGTEKHIGVVGHRSSGKSYLLYAGMHELMDNYKAVSAHQDSDRDTNIMANYDRIRKNAGLQTDVKDAYRAVQLMIEHKPVAYHIYFYDVAGEMFNQRSTSYQRAMTFYKNVQSIIFIIDPTMIDITGDEFSEAMEQWLKTHPATEHFSPNDTYSSMQTILMRAGNSTKHLSITFVCTKADMGYLEACGYNRNIAEKDIEKFMKNDLRLGNVINAARSAFKDVHFDIASVQPEYSDRLRGLFVNVLKQMGVNF